MTKHDKDQERLRMACTCHRHRHAKAAKREEGGNSYSILVSCDVPHGGMVALSVLVQM